MEENAQIDSKNMEIKDKWFFVPIDVFRVKVFLFVGSLVEMGLTVKLGMEQFNLPDKDEIVKFVRNYVEANMQDDDGSNSGDAFGDGCIAFIRLNKIERGNLDDTLILIHESLHVAHGILDYVGIQEGKNKECLCYLQQYIIQEFAKKIRRVELV